MVDVPDRIWACEACLDTGLQADGETPCPCQDRDLPRQVRDFKRQIAELRFANDTLTIAAKIAAERAEAAEDDKARLSEALRVLEGATVSAIHENNYPNRVIFKDGFVLEGRGADGWLNFMRLIQQVTRAAQSDSGVQPTHRHKKRGSEYVLVDFGKMQANDWYDGSLDGGPCGNSVDMSEVAIYYSVDDGSWWVRPRKEFEDGRFELISNEVKKHE